MKDLEIIKDLIEGVEELNGEYQEGWDDTINNGKELVSKLEQKQNILKELIKYAKSSNNNWLENKLNKLNIK